MDIVVGLMVGAAFLVASFKILRPFIQVIVAEGVIAVAIYPLFLGTVNRLGGPRKMVVILLGAIGGMILSGIIGLFVGAVVLALAYRLMLGWLETDAEASPTPSPEAVRGSA